MSPERTASDWRCARSGRQTAASRGHTPPSPGVTAFAQRRPRKMIFVNCGGTDTGHDPPGRSALFDDLARLAAEEHNRALRRPRDCPRVAEAASDASEVVKFRCSRWLGGKTTGGTALPSAKGSSRGAASHHVRGGSRGSKSTTHCHTRPCRSKGSPRKRRHHCRLRRCRAIRTAAPVDARPRSDGKPDILSTLPIRAVSRHQPDYAILQHSRPILPHKNRPTAFGLPSWPTHWGGPELSGVPTPYASF